MNLFLPFPAVSSGLTEDQKLIQGMALNFASICYEYRMFLPFPVVSSGLTEDQKLIQGMALNFAQNEMFPHMAKWDQEEIFPIEVRYVKKFSIFRYLR
jgi:hypothetical protein